MNISLKHLLIIFFIGFTLPYKVQAVDYFLGAYVMPKPLKPSHQFYDLKSFNRLPSTNSDWRKPLLGYYEGDNTQVMDWYIRWAQGSGLSYFVFDEYWTQSQSTPVYNTTLPSFLSSPISNQLQFAVSLTISTVKNNDAQTAADIFSNKIAPYMNSTYFSQPNYLTINGKPVVYIYNNASIFGNNTSPEWISDRLQAFENTVGKDIYWIYATPSSDELNFNHYKQMGYDALSPYYVAPGITGMISSGNATNGIPYSEFILKQKEMHSLFFQKAALAGLAFIPSATTNFDERPRYLNEPWHAKRSYTTNQSIEQYASLLEDIKSQIQSAAIQTPQTVVSIDNKPIIGLGAWNEWSEDAQLEPGFSGLHPQDPYAVLKTIQHTFNVSNSMLFLQTPQDFTPTIPEKSLWNFGNSSDIRDWYINPNTTDILPHASGQYGTFIVDNGQSTYLEGTVNINANNSKGVRLPFSAVCGDVASNCTESIQLTWFSTNCQDDTNNQCTNNSIPNTSGTVGTLLSNCHNKPNDSAWGYCDFIPSENDSSWSGTIEQLRFTFFTNEKHPTYYSIATIQLLPKDTTQPTVMPTLSLRQGDANGDNFVNRQDYEVWLSHFGKLETGKEFGDFNTNGIIDGLDYVIWFRNVDF